MNRLARPIVMFSSSVCIAFSEHQAEIEHVSGFKKLISVTFPHFFKVGKIKKQTTAYPQLRFKMP